MAGILDLIGAAASMAASAASAVANRNNNKTTSSGNRGSSSGGTSSGSSGGYRPLDTSGNDYATMAGVSDIDRAALEAASKSYEEAQAAGDRNAMDAAHRQAETIRAKYGYSGGSDGSQYIPYGTGTPQFSYETAPEYVNRYQDQIDQLTQDILGREPFEYNYLEDPNYQQYAESYTRNGQRAMQDTLGQLAARTGGLASSYATTASQQTYNDYMAALADKVPELRQLAYAMYQDDISGMRSDLDMLTALEQGDYAKYQDLLNQYNNDRNFAYGQYRDTVSDSRYEQEWDYQANRDQISDQRYDNETNYQQAMDRAQLLASIGDFSGYRELGFTDAQIASLESAWRLQNTLSSGGSGGYSGGGGSSVGTSGEETFDERVNRLYMDAYNTENPEAYISNNYKKYGLSSSSDLKKGYKNWYEQNTDNYGELGETSEDLGGAALRMLESFLSNTMTTAQKASAVREALNSGTIKEWEADYLLSAAGL